MDFYRDYKAGSLFVLILSVCFFLQGCATQSREIEAEKFLAEINEIASRKDGSVSELPESIRQDLSTESIRRFPQSRPSLEAAVKQARPYYENDLKKFESIADKYEKMAMLNLNPKYMESVVIQKRRYQLYAQAVELQKSRLELILDKSITDRETLMNRSATIESKIDDLKKEIEAIEQMSDKNKIHINGQN